MFIDRSSPFLHYREDTNRPGFVLSLKGIDFYLERKRVRNEVVLYKTCQVAELPNLIEEFEYDSKIRKATVIVFTRSQHFSSVYFEKDEQGVRVFVFDSLGDSLFSQTVVNWASKRAFCN